MPADADTPEIPEEEPIVNVISVELAHQLAADRTERLRRSRFRRPFERPAVVRSVVAPRGDLR